MMHHLDVFTVLLQHMVNLLVGPLWRPAAPSPSAGCPAGRTSPSSHDGLARLDTQGGCKKGEEFFIVMHLLVTPQN